MLVTVFPEPFFWHHRVFGDTQYAIEYIDTPAMRGVSLGLTQSNASSLLPSLVPVQVNYVRIVVSPMWHGPGNVHGFVLDG